MGDKIQRAKESLGDFAVDTVQQIADERQQARAERDLIQQGRGFKSAASIAQRCIQTRLDALDEKLKTGTLTKADQPVHTALRDLLADIEKESERYWRDSAIEVNWRPVKRVVKGAVIRKREEPQE